MKKLSLFGLMIFFSLNVAACATPSTPVAPTEPAAQPAVVEPTQVVVEPSATPALAAVFQVVKADGTTFDVTLEALKKLPLASIKVDGKVQEGPKLADVLKLAGVTEYAEVTFEGSSASVTLTHDQVDNNTILDFSNRGTLKLATTYIPMPEWTKDITTITVK